MKDNLIVDLTYQFALDVMSVAKALREKKEFELASQLWRAGTSIGANVEGYPRDSALEAGNLQCKTQGAKRQAAQSRPDFRSKMSIAAKTTGLFIQN